MERFTIDDAIKLAKIVANRYKWGAENADMGSEDANELHKDICNQYVKEYEQIAKWLEELKSYKDLEEQGLLARLPVPIGTKVYTIASTFDCIFDYDNCKATQKWKCEEDIQCEYERKSYYVKEIEFIPIMKDSIGKSVFLTREEAEKKLEDMKSGR